MGNKKAFFEADLYYRFWRLKARAKQFILRLSLVENAGRSAC
jgi:hypothetical protein